VVLSRLLGGLGGLYVLVEAFAGLSLDKLQLRKFVEVLLRYFHEKGGARVEEALGAAFR